MQSQKNCITFNSVSTFKFNFFQSMKLGKLSVEMRKRNRTNEGKQQIKQNHSGSQTADRNKLNQREKFRLSSCSFHWFHYWLYRNVKATLELMKKVHLNTLGPWNFLLRFTLLSLISIKLVCVRYFLLVMEFRQRATDEEKNRFYLTVWTIEHFVWLYFDISDVSIKTESFSLSYFFGHWLLYLEIIPHWESHSLHSRC